MLNFIEDDLTAVVNLYTESGLETLGNAMPCLI